MRHDSIQRCGQTHLPAFEIEAGQAVAIIIFAGDLGLATEYFEAAAGIEPREVVAECPGRLPRRYYRRPVADQATQDYRPAGVEYIVLECFRRKPLAGNFRDGPAHPAKRAFFFCASTGICFKDATIR